MPYLQIFLRTFLLLLCIAALQFSTSDSHAADASGTWSGALLQPANPSNSPFNWTLNNLVQGPGGSVVGTETITTKTGSAWAMISFFGTITGNTFDFTNGLIIAQSAGSVWCIKNVTGTISANGTVYSGSWTTTTPACASYPNGTFSVTSVRGNGLGGQGCHVQNYNYSMSSNSMPSKIGQVSVGDPISLGNGNLFEEIDDYRSSGINSLSFTRYYNSGEALATVPSMIAPHWRNTFDRYITIVSATETNVERADGQVIYFTFDSTTSTWKTDKNMNVSLTHTGSETGSTWVFTDLNNTIENYTQGSTGTAFLTTIVQLNGYTQTMTVTSGKLTSVTDSLGRSLSLTYNADNRVSTVTFPGGLLITYGYNSSGVGMNDRLVSISYSTSPVTNQTYSYTAAGFPFALTSIIDENGNTYKTWTYDTATGRVTSSKLGTGTGNDLHSVTYDDTNNNRTVTNALGMVETYKFVPLVGGVCSNTQISRTATATVPAGTQGYTYDANGYLSKVVDWKGNVTNFVNNARGLQTSRTEAFGTTAARTITTTWHPTLNLPTKIVQTGLTTDLTYDINGNLLTKTETDTQTQTVPYSTNGATRTWTWTYDSLGNMLTEDGPRTDVSDVTTYTYTTPAKNLGTVTNALSQVTNFSSYDASGRPLSYTDANGTVTNLTYDLRGLLKTQTVVAASGNAITTYGYDNAEMLTSITAPDNSVLNFTYNDAHKLVAVYNASNERIDYTLDAAGNITAEITKNASAAIRRQVNHAYDSINRLLKDIGYLAAQQNVYAYDANGNRLTITNARNFITTQGFDALNRFISVKSALNQTAATAYDKRDNITQQQDFRGLATNYVYNGFNQAIQASSPDSGTTVYNTIDKAGNVTQETDARGVVTNRTFDALNRILTQTYPAASSENITYGYDSIAGGNKGKGHLTSITDQSGSTAYVYDERGNITQKTAIISGKTYTISYAYDLADKPTLITYPSGRQVQFLYNANGQLTTVNSRATSGGSYVAVASAITFEPFGPLKSFTYGNSLTHARDYNQNYWLSTLRTNDGTTFLQNLTYAYDDAGNITSITDGVTPARNQTFTYDALNRLTQGIGAYGTINYTYYTPSDRQTRVTGGVTQTYNFPAASNRMTSITNSPSTRSLTYTANGNILTDNRSTNPDVAYTWNNRNRKSTVTVGGTLAATYLYDAIGQRVSKVAGAITTHFIYDVNGQLIAEANGATGAPTREFIWLPGGTPLVQVEPSSVFWYVLSDHHGTPQKLTDSTKAIVWDRVQQPFGETQTITGTATSSIRFPGQYADAEDGNYYNYSRDYDPTTGRYLQTDTIGQNGGLNLYKYAESNPLRYTDRRGRSVLDSILIIYFGGRCPDGQILNNDEPSDARDPDGAKAPGLPGPEEGYVPPKGGPKWVPNPNKGKGGNANGWLDNKGRVWVPTGQGGRAHGGPHWDVQDPITGGNTNVKPGNNINDL
jgi:RHS repeat-associated protein